MNEKFTRWMVKEGFGYWVGNEERTRQLYEQQQRYLALQRRTILYSLLAGFVAAYLAIAFVRYYDLSWPTALIVGSVLGFLFAQVAVIVVRRLNPQ